MVGNRPKETSIIEFAEGKLNIHFMENVVKTYKRKLIFRRLADQLFKDHKATAGSHVSFMKVRKGGRKEVNRLEDTNHGSKMVKAGRRTYFFDIKETKDGKFYLVINENWFRGEGEQEESVRNTLMVFPESAQEFAFATNEMLSKIVPHQE